MNIDVKNIENLSLYHYDACPFCQKTRNFMDTSNFNIELRDIRLSKMHKTALIAQGKKLQVPCLRIDLNNETSYWLYESEDIIRFLSTSEIKL
jgi:glutaredoxin 2